MKFYFAIIILILTASCSDLSKSGQLESLDALSSDVEVVKDQMLGLSDSLAVYIAKANELDEALKSTYSNDTLSISTATSIDRLVQLKELFPELKGRVITLDSLLIFKSDVIAQLETDITNGAGDRSKYEEYLSFEEGEVKLVEENIEELIETINVSIEDFNAIHPGVNDYIHSIQVKE